MDLYSTTLSVSPMRFYSSAKSIIEQIKDRKPDTPKTLLEYVVREYESLGRSATRHLRTWRRVRVVVLMSVAPIAPISLTPHAWIAAILGALVTVLEGSLTLWRLPELARVEMDTCNKLESESLKYAYSIAPYDSGSDEERLQVFAQNISNLKTNLAGGYLKTLNAAITAERQVSSHSKEEDAQIDQSTGSPDPEALQ